MINFLFRPSLSDTHAVLSRICGLSGPRSHKKINRCGDDRNLAAGRRHRAGACRHGGGTRPGRPHQRRSPRHPGAIFRRNAPIRRQLPGDVQKSEERAGAQVQGGAVRLSRDKMNKLAHTIADALAEMPNVEFVEDRNTIRMETRKILEELFNQESRIDAAARQKIENQKRTIMEGTQEWDILYRKYYNEEVKKLGI